MNTSTAIAAMISAAAVVGSLAAANVASWFADTAQFNSYAPLSRETEGAKDALKEARDAEYRRLTARFWAVLAPAVLLWSTVLTLLIASLRLALQRIDRTMDYWWWDQEYSPFFLATCALAVALIIIPITLAVVGRLLLGRKNKENAEK